MKCARSAALFVAAILCVPNSAPSATTCVGMPPLKTVHRVCGVVFFPSGDRVTNANVSVLQEEKEIAAQKTDDHGNFAFNQLKSGKYEVLIRVEGVPGVAGTKVVLARPNARAKQEIAVGIDVMIANCSSFSLVNAKQFEAGLNPAE